LLAWTAAPSNRLIGETVDFLEILRSFVQRPRVVGGVVHDARIAAICVANGVETLLTRDRDFSLFPELRTRNPIGS
jgi:predicted nucleic acid-binding protein